MNLYRNSILFLACCFFIPVSPQSGHAQNSGCGFTWLTNKQSDQDSLVIERLSRVNQVLYSSINQQHNHTSARTEILIPVVIHIVWKHPVENISDEAILTQIEALNRDFNGQNADIKKVPDEFKSFVAKKGIRFCLASEDIYGQATLGIIRVKTDIEVIGTKNELFFSALGGSDAWDTEKYLNIWVANTGDIISGFGTFPEQVEAAYQGVVIHPQFFGHNNSINYNLGRVAVHEIGHYFGLNHIWEHNHNCEADDGLEDTPLQQYPYSGCPTHPQISCNSADMFMNFMDYVDDDCMLMFTQNQMERMIAAIEIYRPGLLGSPISCLQNQREELKTMFRIYPNPAKTEITIDFSIPIAESEVIEIYNTLGQLIFHQKKLLINQMQVDLPDLASGCYWIKIGENVSKLMVR